MTAVVEAFRAWVASLPGWLHDLQLGLLQALATVGLVTDVDGQPRWPFGWRIAVETLAIDAALSRQLGLALVAVAVILLLSVFVLVIAVIGAASGRRRRRRRGPAGEAGGEPGKEAGGEPEKREGGLGPGAFVAFGLTLAGGAGLALAVLPAWPPLTVVLRPAVATSFHRLPPSLDANRLAGGLALYADHCAGCHGVDGRGETAQAASLPIWPPRLTGALLWKRAEGELFWHLRHGMRGRDGQATMPGFADQLSVSESWDVLAALRLLASGQALADQGQWPWPVAAPDLALDCGDLGRRRLSDWRGQRIQLAVAGADQPWPDDDPRFETAVLDLAPTPRPVQGCRVLDAAALGRLLTTVALRPGETLDGLRLLIDRDGWLRARSAAGGWRDEDLVCRTSGEGIAGIALAGVEPAASGTARNSPAITLSARSSATTDNAIPGAGLPSTEAGLDRLIRRMDADPIPAGRTWLAAHGRDPRPGSAAQ